MKLKIANGDIGEAQRDPCTWADYSKKPQGRNVKFSYNTFSK
jgi:hypothetical protein